MTLIEDQLRDLMGGQTVGDQLNGLLDFSKITDDQEPEAPTPRSKPKKEPHVPSKMLDFADIHGDKSADPYEEHRGVAGTARFTGEPLFDQGPPKPKDERSFGEDIWQQAKDPSRASPAAHLRSAEALCRVPPGSTLPPSYTSKI